MASVRCPRFYLVHVKHQEDGVCLTLLLSGRELGMCSTSSEAPYRTGLQLARQFLLCGVRDLHLVECQCLSQHGQASSEVSHSKTIVLNECRGEQIQAVIFRNTKVFLSRSDFFNVCVQLILIIFSQF